VKNKRKFLVALVTISMLLMLPGLTAQAANKEYTNEEINRLGANRFKMINSIGVHTFNFSEPSDSLESEGYLYLANTYDYPVKVRLEVITKLSVVDLDDNGNPRTHKVTPNVLYNALPTSSWIKLEETEFTINPKSEYKVKYKVIMPTKDAYESIKKDNDNGFLCYINIKSGEESMVNVNYNYKCFLTFEGEYKEKSIIDSPFTIFILINIILISILICIGTAKWLQKRKIRKGAIIEAED